MEDRELLQRKLDALDSWFRGRVDIAYPDQYAAKMVERAYDSTSEELQGKDRTDIAEIFSKESVANMLKDYVSRCYNAKFGYDAIVEQVVDGSEKAKPLSLEDQAHLDAVTGSLAKHVRFVDSISNDVLELEEEEMYSAFDNTFRETYGNPAGFAASFVAIFKLTIYDSHRQRTEPRKPVFKEGSAFGDLERAGDEFINYAHLNTDETVKAYETFLPKVFEIAMCDLYQ